MRITADIKRLAFTTIACFITAAVCFSIPDNNVNMISPFLFTLAIILTNTDRLKIGIYKAILLGLILTLAVFFITLLSTIGLGSIMSKYSILFCSSIAAVLMFLVNSLYLKMGSLKIGLTITAFLAFCSFPVLEELNKSFPNFDTPIALAVDPSYFFISWQTLAGLGISIGIWLEIKAMPAPNIGSCCTTPD